MPCSRRRRRCSQALAHELDKTHSRVAASLREGLAETLTVLRLGVPPTLARTFRSTNATGSVIGICRSARLSPVLRPRRAARAGQGEPRHHLVRDESLEDLENLPSPEVIAREIVEDLTAALVEFEAVAAALEAAAASYLDGRPTVS